LGRLDKMARTTQQWLSKLKVFKDEKGLTLVESLVAIAIVGVVLVAFTVALSTGVLAVSENDQEVTVQSLARTQLEYIKGYPYDSEATTYPTVDTSDNYSISVAVASVPDTDANIQKITANISRDGQVLLTVEDYKVNR
jgi:prepilin-type N-terminal cleavage/methylation domain-containing protein